MTHRPRGVLAIAIIFIILAALGIREAIYWLTFLVPSFQNLLQVDSLAIYCALSVNLTPLTIFRQFGILLIIFSATNLMSYIDTYELLAVAALIGSGLFILSCVGLLRMKKWGYYIALILGMLGVIGGVLVILYYIERIIIEGIISLILGIIIVAYLMGKVEHEFEK